MQTLTEKAVELIAYLDKNEKADKKASDPLTVGELLAQSRAAHLVYRRSLRHRANGVTADGDPVAAAESLAVSARLRAQAEIQDPIHTNSAWADDLAAKFPHTALLEFYAGETVRLLPPIDDAKPVDENPKPVDEPPKDVTADAEAR